MLERLVGLPAIRVLDVERDPLQVHVETRPRTVERCTSCVAQAPLALP